MKEEGNKRRFTEMRRKASLLVEQHEERHRGGKVKTVLENSIRSASRRIEEGLLLGERKRQKRCNILARGMSETRLCMKRKVNAFPPDGNQNEVSGNYCQDLSRLKGSKDFIP